MTGLRASLLALALLGAGAGPAPARPAAAEDAPAGSVPFPLTGRQTVRAEGKIYVIDGKQVIPGGSIIRVEASVRIVGINKASLEVKGGLLVHGTMDCWVKIENVDFSPTVAPDNELHFDMADLHGCRFDHGEAGAYDGGFTFENSALQRDCTFRVRMRSGFLRFMTANVKVPWSVDGASGKGRRPEVAIRTSWMNAVTLSGDLAATVRDSEVRGPLEGRDFTGLIVDGCDLFGDASFRQKAEGTFSGLQLLKSNLFGGSKLTLARPTGPKTAPEKVRVEKWHFEAPDEKAETTDKQIAERIQDGADDPAVSVKAFWQNPQDRKHVFLSDALRRRRPP